ncbi:RDD family protein [Streptomyces sp. NPDC088350]|uniref:RDD family protein n=1 Tax=Streptomyces sp. NPDC088350 TaxID=3365854 RepID=UPI0038287D81
MSAPTPAPGDDRPREGYYPDPSIPGYVRYWNGASWVPGTSRPAPSDGLPPGAGPSVEETGPHFFDEDPAPENRADPARAQHGSRPEPATAWGADRAHQSGFGGDQDRRVSWGAPDPRVPTDTPASPDEPSTPGTFVFRRPTPPGTDTPDEGTTTFRRPPPRTPQQGGAPGAQGGGAGPAGAFDAQGSTGSGSGAGGFGAQGGAGSGTGAGGFGSQVQGGADSAAGRFGSQGSAGSAGSGSGAGRFGAQGPVGTGSAAGGFGASPSAGDQSSRAGGQTPVGNAPLSDPPGPGFGAGKAAAARAAVQAQAGTGTGAPASALSGVQQSAPGVPSQPGPPQASVATPAPLPMATGTGGGQPSWAQQVHRLAGDEDGPVAPWKPPVEDVFQAAARRQSAARPAGLGKRLVARLVDTAVLGAVTGAVAVPLGTRAADHINEKIDAAKLSGRTETVWLLDGTTAAYLGIVLAVLLLFGVLYEVLPTAKWGRTLGKKLCGLEVRGIESHEPPGFGGALRRWLVYCVPGLLGIGVVGVAWCLFDRPWRQCWHDKAAHTFVAG